MKCSTTRDVKTEYVPPRVRRIPRTSRWPMAGFALFIGAGSLVLTACGGGINAPGVASLRPTTSVVDSHGSSHPTGSTTSVSASGNPTELMDEWAACMRAHGDPNQTDPVIDQYGVINITMHGATPAISNEVHGSSGPCSQYEVAAENALRASQPVAPAPDQAQQVQYAGCMRTHGIPNYPDPGPDGETNFNSIGVDPNSPFFVNANKVCGKEINAPAWWINGTGPPGDVTVTNINGPVPSGGIPSPNGKGGPSVIQIPGTPGR
jgi:hypothetical protein